MLPVLTSTVENRLSSGVSLFRNRIGPKTLRWINRIAGAIIGAFGLYALLSVLV